MGHWLHDTLKISASTSGIEIEPSLELQLVSYAHTGRLIVLIGNNN
jgi:hypothetical protein